jgi:tRNA-Thr(GGU) m(6)t(6)A37 methyltransferase TsaA
VVAVSNERIAELEKQIAELKERWPAHSVPPALMEQLDELEEELRLELKRRDEASKAPEVEAERFLVRAIGYVENKFDEPAPPDQIRAAEAHIIIDPALVEGLQGLEAGQQVMVIFCFHRSEGYDLLQHPRGDINRDKRGVFALRSPQRPNPIGVTEVELVRVEGNVLTVLGLDAINGTPVLDLKPS